MCVRACVCARTLMCGSGVCGEHSLHGHRGQEKTLKDKEKARKPLPLSMCVIGRFTASGRCVVFCTIKSFLKIIFLLKSYTLLIAF